MKRQQVRADVDVTFEWQVFEVARDVMVLDGWGNLLGTFRTMGGAVLAMLAVEAGPPLCQDVHNDNEAA